jgi:hypothetical protein
MARDVDQGPIKEGSMFRLLCSIVARILDYREKKGPFKKIEDLREAAGRRSHRGSADDGGDIVGHLC